MMRRLRKIQRRMLARTAVQPRVLVALIQCATMATVGSISAAFSSPVYKQRLVIEPMVTEVVEVATESEEDVVINCVAIFYEEGKDGVNFRKKNKFRCPGGGGDSHMERTGMLVGNFEFNP